MDLILPTAPTLQVQWRCHFLFSVFLFLAQQKNEITVICHCFVKMSNCVANKLISVQFSWVQAEACEPSSCLSFVKPQQDCWGVPESLQLKIIQHGQHIYIGIMEKILWREVMPTAPKHCHGNSSARKMEANGNLFSSNWTSYVELYSHAGFCWSFHSPGLWWGKSAWWEKQQTPSLALHMERLNNSEDINKDRVQVLSKEATPCFSSKEPWV